MDKIAPYILQIVFAARIMSFIFAFTFVVGGVNNDEFSQEQKKVALKSALFCLVLGLLLPNTEALSSMLGYKLEP